MKLREPGSHTLTMEHQDRQRKYVVYVPKTGEVPFPVVLAFHGAGGTARIMLHHSRWAHRADISGFVVVAPEGTPPKLDEKPSFRFNPQLWNLGGASMSSLTADADDVGFVNSILDQLSDHVQYDASRVYSTGFSNGAGLTFRLAIEMGHRLAAISPVAGIPSLSGGKTARPVPMTYYIGSLDPLAPWEGGPVTSPWSNKTSLRPNILEALTRWTEESGFHLSKKLITNNISVEEAILGTAEPDLVARYTKWNGLGHHWPGGKDVGVPVKILGPRIKTPDVTEQIWDFFSKYQWPGSRKH